MSTLLLAGHCFAAQEVTADIYKCRDQGEVASQTEDRLLEVLKAVGARVDSAVGTFTNLSSFGRMEQSEVSQPSHLHPLHVCAKFAQADTSCQHHSTVHHHDPPCSPNNCP